MAEMNTKAIVLARLTEDEIVNLANFNCGDDVMNEFIKTEAFDEQELGLNTTILLYYEGSLAAFCSICTDSIKLAHSEKEDFPYATIPVIKIARLGRDIKFSDFGFGRYMIEVVIGTALEINESDCGVRMLTLDAYPGRVGYYEYLGFEINQHKEYKKRENISMRYDIFHELL